jgi:TM2 domain-containing membrane protein YozV
MPRKSKHSPLVAAVLSLLVPGLGQIYAGKQERGASILVAGIIIGTLALIWQTLFLTVRTDVYPFWLYRIGLVVYAFVFWIWQVSDAYKQAQ